MAGPCSVESTRAAFYGRGAGGEGGRARAARRRLQAAIISLFVSGNGRGGSEAVARGRRTARPAGDQRGDGDFADPHDDCPTSTFSRWARATCRTSTCCANWGKFSKPVLLKRGIAATLEELLLSAEYIMAGGNYDVILCERGIRTFETYTRNTMDISAIPIIQETVAPADDGRPVAWHGTARQGAADGARLAGGRRGRAADRSPQRSRQGIFRRRAVAVSRPVRQIDGRVAA